MSGTAAAIALQGGGISDAIAADLAAAIRHRGQSGIAVRREDGCCLVHADAGTSGERGHNLEDDGASLRIVGDVRLDNRDELATMLGLAPAGLSGTDLVLTAYRRWGPDCCERLIGDFAFAIWHAETKTLFSARDQFGVKPLFYCTSTGRVAVSSELAAVVPASAAVNESCIAGYLLGVADDPEATAFAGAYRLPPGHWLRVAGGAVTVQRYWSLEADDRRAADPAEEFRGRFEKAVASRLHGPGVGAMLSGGLDSSAIASVAASRHQRTRGKALPVYSFDYPATPALSERPFVDAVLARHALDPVFVGLDDLRPIEGLAGVMGKRSDLFFAPGLPKIGRVYREARSRGTVALLEGHGGDEVVSHGHGRIGELARSGDWLSLYRELRGVSGTFGESPAVLLAKLFMSAGPGRVLSPVMRRLRRSGPASSGTSGTALLNPAFAQRSGAEERSRAWLSGFRDASRTEDTLHRWTLTSPAIAEGFEALDRAAAREGVELRYPFFDQRLVRYAVGLPASEKLRDGWSRSILRRAMDGILPPEVQWRRDKIDFSSELSTGLARHHRDLLDEAAADGAGIGRYVDLGRLRGLVADLVARPAAVTGLDLFALWRSLFLMLWLKNEGA